MTQLRFSVCRLRADFRAKTFVKMTVIAASLLIGMVCPARASEPPEVITDEVGLLYSSQMQFGNDGFPQVTIGLMEDLSSVAISSVDGLELTFQVETEGQLIEKTLKAPARQDWSFKVQTATVAQVVYWCGVESIEFARKDLLSAAIKKWTERQEKVQIFEVGSVFGIRGHVIDNRTYILGIRSFASEDLAKLATVEIFEKYGTRTFVHAHLRRRPSGLIKIIDAAGRPSALAADLIKIRSVGGKPVIVRKVEYGKGYRWHGYQDRQYAGTILVTIDRNGRLVVVNRIGVERLLEGLVPAEIHSSVPMEALKAQAVVARGEVFAKIGSRHFLDPYLLCASTHCQVYSGVRVEKERPSLAVRATQGGLLFLGQSLVDSVYSASCGGHTENNDTVWSDPPSQALRGKLDLLSTGHQKWLPVKDNLSKWLSSNPPAFCKVSTLNRKGLFRWTRDISSAQMDKLVAKTKPIGQVVSIQVLSRGVSGRVKVIRVVGTEGDLLVQREWPIRQLFGNLRSGMFEVSIEVDEDQMPKNFKFVGGGWGHGVGLCQIGAVGRAEHGFSYKEILSHYYGGAEVYQLYGKIYADKPRPVIIKDPEAGDRANLTGP
ncbi:MAG: SpoIID/LytB domain-containing protein [Deltaproteobacteria bacterium]|nr:SpoIID/LytB domain-containing protein [Deltaproteobacteria bacterium]MBW1871058.1 SpoIID/LytB domain-containing protein [Deltaproteobacteria bacterium]